MRPLGEAERQLRESDTEFIQAFLEILREFYTEAYTALMEIYSKSSENKRYRDFLAVRRFIKCNFGLYDNVIDIDENWNFRFEFVGCPLRGECKSDKIICAPKFNSKLSDRQLEVMRLLYEGKSDSEIADKLVISLNTVNNHRKNRTCILRSTHVFCIFAVPNLYRCCISENLASFCRSGVFHFLCRKPNYYTISTNILQKSQYPL